MCLPSSRDKCCRALSKYLAGLLFEFQVAIEYVECLVVMCSEVVLVCSVRCDVVCWLLLGPPFVPLVVSSVSGGLPVEVFVLGL